MGKTQISLNALVTYSCINFSWCITYFGKHTLFCFIIITISSNRIFM